MKFEPNRFAPIPRATNRVKKKQATVLHRALHGALQEPVAVIGGTHSDKHFSKQSLCQRPACAKQCSVKIGMAIRCKNLQGFQHRRNDHHESPDHKGPPGPSEPDDRRGREIAEEMIHLPTEPRAGRLPLGGAQMDVHEEGNYGDAAKSHPKAHPSPKQYSAS
jgi:hypothetical protein